MESILAQAGCAVDPSSGGVVQPIHLATTYERDVDGGYSRQYKYGRFGNPNRVELESILCHLEAASCGFAFASGMAAGTTLLQSLEPNSTIVLPHDVYHGVRVLIESVPGLTLRPIYVDFNNEAQVDEALGRSPALVWLETPSNPMMRVTDISRVCARCRPAGIPVVVDGTWTTPLLQRPLSLGADIVLHSLTKYMSGHSDVLGGALLFATESNLAKRVGSLQDAAGSVLDPFSCWLTLRGMRTLALRMERHCSNALRIAEFLVEHERVASVNYPWLSMDGEVNLVARKQMTLGGGMVSFEVGRKASEALEVVSRVRLIKRATSLGATESLIEHRRSMEDEDSTTPETLIRLSVGLENVDDLIDDLRQALV